MKLTDQLRARLSGFYGAISRYPLTLLFLIAAAAVNAAAIHQDADYMKYFLTCLVGAFLGFTVQAAWERWHEKLSVRALLMGASILLTLGYFLIVNRYATTSIETSIRTDVALFALAIAYIWVPVIKSRVSFNESFITAFKCFFNSALFAAVLFLGVSLIITATDLLLFRVDEEVYAHAANIISVLFAPLYFLSLIPVYPGVSEHGLTAELKEGRAEGIRRSAACPRFLEILISYIIIPLLGFYTVILVAYIATNITGEFWSDNRLEPMFVGYAITVILVYILASSIENRFTALFRRVFPKLLVPIVLFQIAASIMRTLDTGMMHGRYYVILFGIYAAITSMLLSFLPVRKNGIVAALLIAFSVISIVPPIDAFTISRANQMDRLEAALVNNTMLQDGRIIPNEAVSEKDREIISQTVNYLSMMEYTKNISYLGKDFDAYEDFYKTFGFYRYEDSLYGRGTVNLSLDPLSPIDVSGYDRLVVVDSYYEARREEPSKRLSTFDKDGVSYTLTRIDMPQPGRLQLTDKSGKELISLELQKVFDHFDTSAETDYQISKDSVPAAEAVYTLENDGAALTLVAQHLYIDKSSKEPSYGGTFYVLIKIK